MAGSYGRTIGRISIKVLPDANDFRRKIKEEVENAERKYKIELPVDVDTTRASLKLDDFYQQWEKQTLQFKVAIEQRLAEAQLDAIARNRTATIKVKTENKGLAAAEGFLKRISGFRVAVDLFKDVNDAILNLDKSVGTISRLSLSIASLTSSVISLAGGLVTTSGDLLKIVNIGLLGPAAFAGFGVGVTALVIALKTMGDELGSLGPAFSELKGIIQSNFWDQARDPILDLVNNALPALRAGMGAVSTAIGKQMGQIATSLDSALGGGVLERLFGTLAKTINIVTGAMDPLVRAFVKMGEVGSTFLPGIARAFVDVSTKFNDWVQATAASGEMFRFIQEGLDNLVLAAKAVGAVAGIFRALDSAATNAGAGGLATFTGALQGAAAILKSPEVQNGLTTLFSGARVGVSAVGAGIKDIGAALINMAPTFAGVFATAGATVGGLFSAIADALQRPEFQSGLTNLFSGIQTGVAGLQTAMPAIADILGKLGTLVGTLAAAFGPLIATIKNTFAPALESIIDIVTLMVPIFSGMLTGAIAALAPLVARLAGFFDRNKEAIAAVATGIGFAVIAFLALQKAIAAVKFVAMIAGFVRLAIVKTADAIITARLALMYAVDFVKSVASTIAILGLSVGAWAKATAAKVKDKAVGLALRAMYAGDMVRALAATVAGLAKQAAAWAASTAKMVANKAVAAGMKAAGIVQMIAGTVTALGRQAIAWTVSTARMVAFKVAALAIGVAQKALAAGMAIATAAQWLFNAAMTANPIGIIIVAIAALVAALVYFFTQTKLGQQVFANVVSFIKTAIAGIVTVFQTVVGWIAANWPLLLAILTGPIGLLVLFVTTHFAEIQAVIGTVITAVSEAWSAFWAGLVAVVSLVWQGIVLVIQTYINIWVTIITTVISTVTSAWSAFWTGLVSLVTTIFGLVSTAVQTVITTIQQYIAIGVMVFQTTWSAAWNAIKSVVTTVFGAVSGVVNGVINTVKAYISAGTAVMKSTWSAAWNAIKSVVSSVFGAVSGVVNGVINTVRSSIQSGIATARSVWQAGWSAISSAVSSAAGAIRGVVSGMVSAVTGAVSNVGSAFSGIKGRITSALAGAGSWLLSAGRAIVQGLIDGITSMIGNAGSAISGVMGKISSFLPHSPAKEGPFSGKGWTPYSGRALVDGLAEGMESRTNRVRKAALAMVEAANVDIPGIDISEGNTGLADARKAQAQQLQLLAMGTNVTVQGDVGYDPQAIADEIDIRKRQAQMSVDFDSLITP